MKTKKTLPIKKQRRSRLAARTGSAPTFYWKKCYEQDGKKHWAICDSVTDKESNYTRISSSKMVLTDHYSEKLDDLVANLIPKLLTAHFAKAQNIPSSATPQAGLEPRKRNGGEQ